MTAIKANQINQLLDGRRVLIREHQNASGTNFRGPLVGWIVGASPADSGRTNVLIRQYDDRHSSVYFPRNWELDIDLETPRYE